VVHSSSIKEKVATAHSLVIVRGCAWGSIVGGVVPLHPLLLLLLLMLIPIPPQEGIRVDLFRSVIIEKNRELVINECVDVADKCGFEVFLPLVEIRCWIRSWGHK